MLDIFIPYIPFVFILVQLVINVFLIFKGVNIWAILIMNVIISVLTAFVPSNNQFYNVLKDNVLLTKIATEIGGVLWDIVKALWDNTLGRIF